MKKNKNHPLEKYNTKSLFEFRIHISKWIITTGRPNSTCHRKLHFFGQAKENHTSPVHLEQTKTLEISPLLEM
jgi:hypothetical protein